MGIGTIILDQLEATAGSDPGRPCAQGELIPKLDKIDEGFVQHF